VVRRVTGALRIWVLVAAFAQAALPGVASVVDASVAAAAPQASVHSHIESHGTPKCPRVHQEDTCAICRFVSGAVGMSTDTEAPYAPSSHSTRVAGTRHQLAYQATAGDPSLPRAPPTLA
jgi:hypothetical protein